MKEFGWRKRIEHQLRVWLGRAYRPAQVEDLGATMFGDGDMAHGLVWLNAYIVTVSFTLLALVLTCNLIWRSLSVSVLLSMDLIRPQGWRSGYRTIHPQTPSSSIPLVCLD